MNEDNWAWRTCYLSKSDSNGECQTAPSPVFPIEKFPKLGATWKQNDMSDMSDKTWKFDQNFMSVLLDNACNSMAHGVPTIQQYVGRWVGIGPGRTVHRANCSEDRWCQTERRDVQGCDCLQMLQPEQQQTFIWHPFLQQEVMGKWHKGQHAHHEAPSSTWHLIIPRLTVDVCMWPQQWLRQQWLRESCQSHTLSSVRPGSTGLVAFFCPNHHEGKVR